MKKITLILFAFVISFEFASGQVTSIEKAPLDNSTTQVRAPNGLSTYAYLRACALVLQSELSNIAPNTMLTHFGFTLQTGVATNACTGNFTVYLQNTTDNTYQKGTNWPTIITGMTTVYANVMTVPLAGTTTSVLITLSTPFNYTGGGLYVAYDWYSAGPYGTGAGATYLAESLALTPGCASANAGTGGPAPTTLGTTAFRPSFLFGFQNPYNNDVSVVGIGAPGRVTTLFNTTHTINAVVRNTSSVTINNITVNLDITGANPLTTSQNISSLAPGNATVVPFTANPMNLGANTISVSVGADQNNSNNTSVYSQTVVCDEWATNPAVTGYTYQAVGFGAGSGILMTPFYNPVNSALTGIRGGISTNAASVGNQLYGVLLSSTGVTLATTSPITITAPMLGTLVNFTFANQQNLAPNTNYYIGIAQTANAVAYYPAGTYSTTYLPDNLYYSTGLAGGTPAVITQNFGYFAIEAIFSPTVPVLTQPATSVTCGQSATLSAATATSYNWSNSATTQSIVVNTLSNAVYSVYSTPATCQSWTIMPVTVAPLPIMISSSSNTSCAGDAVTLNATGANSFTWTTPTGTMLGNSISVSPTVTTAYTIIGDDPNGCAGNGGLVQIVNPLPIVNLSSSSPSICLGNSVTITATGNGTSHIWSNGMTGSVIVVSPSSVFSPTCLVAGANGCVASKSITVIVDSFTPGISSDTTICYGVQLNLVATGGLPTSYQWSTGSIFPGILVTPSVTTEYTVKATGPNACVGTNSVTITVNSNPTITAAASRSNICKGEASTLTVSGADTYSWSTNNTLASFTISPPSNIVYTYSVVGTNNVGCTDTAFVSLKVNSCTGLAEADGYKAVRIWPNPGNGHFKVELDVVEPDTRITIYNALGALVNDLNADSSRLEVDLRDQPNGLYFVNITRSGQTLSVTRVIKQ